MDGATNALNPTTDPFSAMLTISNVLVFFVAAMQIPTVLYGVQGQVTTEELVVLQSVPVRLQGLDVQLYQTDYTDAAGRFYFAGVPRGSYYVIVSVKGFDEVRQRVLIPQENNAWIFVRRSIASSPDESSPAIGGRNSVDVRQLSIPRNAVNEYEEALEAEKDGDVLRAMQRLNKALDMAPRFYEAAVELARMHVDRKEYEAAVNVLRSNLPGDSTVAGAAFYLGFALYNLRQYDDAEDALTTSLLWKANKPATRLALANVFIRKIELEKAIEQIDAYLEENPDSAQRAEVEEKRSELMRFLDQRAPKHADEVQN
jgi:tetratricopeptide (TPR) repeat protein